MSSLNLSIGTISFSDVDTVKAALEAIKVAGITAIDTATIYGDNEANLGAAGAASTYGLIISTKNAGGWRNDRSLQPENLVKTTKESLAHLQIDQMDIFYIHAPDRTMKLEEWVPTVQELYKQGAFRRFGVSNFAPDEVRALHDYSKKHGYVLPTVYQGNYNAVSRSIESTLFPVLRELGIAFYAYSPIAGGFLTKSRALLEDGTEGGRFMAGQRVNDMYRNLYMKPSLMKALDMWDELAEKQGVSKAELAYRWVYYHSAIKPELGDTLILGASKVEQIQATVDGLKKGPLKDKVVKGIDAIWDGIKHEAIVDNFDATQTV